MNVVLIDNYDSFTYNLYHLLTALGATVTVVKNDCFEVSDLEAYDKIVLSPGPGVPKTAGKMEEVISHYAGTKPILGICLGEQAIGEVFGAKLLNLPKVYHGVQTPIKIYDSTCIFEGLPNTIDVGRYHSWVVDKENFPDELIVTAVSDEGDVMALRHRTYSIYGIQFHPESIMTPFGKVIIENFLDQ